MSCKCLQGHLDASSPGMFNQPEVFTAVSAYQFSYVLYGLLNYIYCNKI